MRKVFQFLLLCCVVGFTSTAEAYVPEWAKHGPQGINFTNIAPSPDGKIIAFEYTDNKEGKGPTGVGFVDLRSSKLTRVPNPPGRELRKPSFSYDGKNVLVGIGNPNIDSNQIAEVNLATLKVTPLTPEGPKGRVAPVYQPGTGKVLYVNGSGLYGLILLDPKTGTEKVILNNKENGFGLIVKPFFIGQTEVLFEAIGPRNFEMQKRHALELHLGPFASYQLTFGGMPKLFSEAEEVKIKGTMLNGRGAFGYLSASKGGKEIVFMRVPSDQPTVDGKIHRELYKIDNDAVMQITDAQSTMMFSCVSYDGSIVTFVANITEPSTFDLFIYDMKSGEIKPTNLLNKIRNDPAFALR